MKRWKPTPPLRGDVTVPGDKSISHRALIVAALANGTSRLTGLNTGDDVRATAACVSALGVAQPLTEDKGELQVEGGGWDGLREPEDILDARNSGTTLRSLLGVCAGVEGLCVLTGDESLRRRPMLRVVVPLRQLGAAIDGRAHGDRPPLVVRGGDLVGAEVEIGVASAQVKTALLLAGLRAEGRTVVIEPGPSRDHTERMLTAAGVDVTSDGAVTAVAGGARPAACDRRIPGDISSAAFLVAAAVLVEGSELVVSEVGLNPTRTGFLDVLRAMGADVTWETTRDEHGEPVGRVRARASEPAGTEIAGEVVVRAIDELPLAAVVASQARGETTIRDAAELRVKESDRIDALVAGLRALGGDLDARPDGLVVRGPTPLVGGQVDARGDHRIALSFAVAGLVSREAVRVKGWSCVDTSFPEFLDVLGRAQGRTL